MAIPHEWGSRVFEGVFSENTGIQPSIRKNAFNAGFMPL
jgi:hypothetical protein